MKKTVVNREELLSTVKENRQEHKETYDKACEEYRERVAELFRKKLDEAQNGSLPDPSVDLEKPVEFLDDYDRAIRMLEMDQRGEIELSENEFKRLVMDEWGWNSTFIQNTSKYVS